MRKKSCFIWVCPDTSCNWPDWGKKQILSAEEMKCVSLEGCPGKAAVPSSPTEHRLPRRGRTGMRRLIGPFCLDLLQPTGFKSPLWGDGWHDRADLGSPESECRAELYLCAFCATLLGWVPPFSGPQGLHLHEVGWIIALRRPLMTPTVCLSWVNLPQLGIKERTGLCLLISF